MQKLLLTFSFLVLSIAASAQLQLPVPSPSGSTTQQVGLTNITVTYSRPSSRGRAIWGNVVPYKAIWRTGANASTKVQFSTDVKIGGTAVPAGTYALVTIPTETTWTVIFNKDLSISGAQGYKEEQDAARVIVTPRKGDYSETFTIGVNNLKDSSCDLELRWDDLVIAVPVEVEVGQRALANINTALNGTWRSYAQAATYLLEKTNEIETAKKYAETSISLKEDVMNTQALSRIYAKMGDFNAAVKTAERSLELAKAIENEGTREFYVQGNEKNLTEWRPKVVVPTPPKKKK
jgi:hypothetical protein